MSPLRRLFFVGMLLGTRSWDSGCEPHYTIKKGLMVCWGSFGSDQAVCREELLVADVLGLKQRSDHMGVALLYIYYDSRR